jgi:hypothetical protein
VLVIANVLSRFIAMAQLTNSIMAPAPEGPILSQSARVECACINRVDWDVANLHNCSFLRVHGVTLVSVTEFAVTTATPALQSAIR